MPEQTPEMLQEAQDQLSRALRRASAGEDQALLNLLRDHGERAVYLLAGLLRLSRIHSLDNQAFDYAISEFRTAVERVLDLLGMVNLVTVENQVYLNDVRVRMDDREDGESFLSQELRRHAIGGMFFHTVPHDSLLRAFIEAIAGEPVPSGRRAAVQAKLDAVQSGAVELTPIYRFRMTGEEKNFPRNPQEVAEQAASLVDLAFQTQAHNRLPNPLPLRRIVTEILAIGPAFMEWTETSEMTPHAAHTLRVCRYALMIGEAMKLPRSDQQDLGVAAMFHDIGYAAQEGALPGQLGVAPPFERHGVAGARLILRQRGFHEAKVRRALASLDHHRAWRDPRGRPSLFGRILRIGEDYDTMIRPRGGGMSPPEALAVMATWPVYDPVLLQLFINLMGRFPPGSRMLLEDGRVVESLSFARGPETFDKPLVRVLMLPDRRRPEKETVLDLAQLNPAAGTRVVRVMTSENLKRAQGKS